MLTILVAACGSRASAPLFAQARLGAPVFQESASDSRPDQPLPDVKRFQLPTSQPTPDQLFRLESDTRLFERMQKEYLEAGQKKVLFPKGASAREPVASDVFPRTAVFRETVLLCHWPLYFADEDGERHGLYHPLIQPFCSTSRFYLDTLCLPFRMAATPPWVLRYYDLGAYRPEISR